MLTNSEKVLSYYEDFTKRAGEENRATSSRSVGLEFHYTKKALNEFVNENSRVIEVGCGTGYYGLHFAEKCKEYVGIELYQSHIDIFNRKIKENGLKNVSCQQGNAMCLTEIENNSFNVVCCLGPMYHLPPEDREIVLAECKRVCTPGGVIALAYINKIGVYVGACVQFSDAYPNKKANDCVLGLGINDEDAPFYFTTPEEMEDVAARHGLSKIRNIGTDSFITTSVVDKMDDEKFELYMALSDEMFKHESCTGMSNHALLICRKLSDF
jgi:ubiquinone/menaquinone biosynthesis C-methylase UbiE